MNRFPLAVVFLSFGLACSSVPERQVNIGEVEQSLDDPGINDALFPASSEPPINIVNSDGSPFSPVHASLLPDGRVLFYGLDRQEPPGQLRGSRGGVITPTPLGEELPETIAMVDDQVPVEFDAEVFGEWTIDETPFCSGHTLLADGSVLAVGGTRIVAHESGTFAVIEGVDYGMLYGSDGWERTPRMVSTVNLDRPARWYPTATRLSDGKVLVTSGFDKVALLDNGELIGQLEQNQSTELYDPATNSFSMVTDPSNTPAAIVNGDYTHVFQRPGQSMSVLALGQLGLPYTLDVESGSWSEAGPPRTGTVFTAEGAIAETPNNGASTVMLPIRASAGDLGYSNGSVLVVGGDHESTHEYSMDVYDTGIEAWLPRINMGVRRHHPSTVLLPTGEILIFAGHDDIDNSPFVGLPQILNFQNGTLTHGSVVMEEVRGYHTFGLLLPDGRVMVGGGRTGGPDVESNEQPNFRYYHPSYMAEDRPALLWADAEPEYNSFFWAVSDRRIASAALVGLGSMTHSFDMNQRHIELALAYSDDDGIAALVTPSDASVAPPGHYMLFLMDEAGVPSVAQIVHLD